LLRFRPETACTFTVRGRITVYEDRGELQISAEFMEPQGAGALQLAFEQLKARLAAEDCLRLPARHQSRAAAPNRHHYFSARRRAARHPEHSGAAASFGQCADLSAQVQGDAAAGDVIAGLRYFQERARAKDQDAGVDVIVIARAADRRGLGGIQPRRTGTSGCRSEDSVISAIGHETDFTIVDFVADLRAPTPSAAASW